MVAVSGDLEVLSALVPSLVVASETISEDDFLIARRIAESPLKEHELRCFLRETRFVFWDVWQRFWSSEAFVV